MMTNETLKDILNKIQNGTLNINEAMDYFRDLPFKDLGHTKFDLHRSLRNGFPEVIYAEGKTPEQVADIFIKVKDHANILATRVSQKTAKYVQSLCADVNYDSLAKILTFVKHDIKYQKGKVSIITAGTSDLAVAQEAFLTCNMLGTKANIISDIGVAGIHRLFNHLDKIRKAKVLIVVAGMEGALASVIGGLVNQPIIAVPTSVGYGANFSGLSALLGMLTSCASGITVVNIDNGFGAACAACRINNMFN